MPLAVISAYNALSFMDQNIVALYIAGEVIIVDFHKYEQENRFEDKLYCLHCESNNVCKNGKDDKGHQRYKCNDCKKRLALFKLTGDFYHIIF